MQTAVIVATGSLSVRLSVRPSHSGVLSRRIVRFSALGRNIILVSGEVKFIRIFAGDHHSEGVELKHPIWLAKN